MAAGVSYLVILLTALCALCAAYRYDAAYTEYNLNQNPYAVSPLQYWGQWHDSPENYTSSPDSWRVPFYTLFLDRFVNGDPFNDNINGTAFEHDLDSNQMRHGGDLQGLVDALDYIQGMGIKALYVAGSPFINQPWGYDAYSPLDLSLLDPHHGTLEMWRRAIEEIHARDMRIVLDNTIATMGDLIGFEGYLNESAPFTPKEYNVLWKSSREYHDFSFGNTYNNTCEYPRFWNETGLPVDPSVREMLVGCYDSDFDQYGDTEAFDYQVRSLREWHAPVRQKLENFYCMVIAQLDIDGFRYDKATQSTPDAMAALSASLRSCARRFGKTNFYITGEITGGNTFASIYLGRGRQPDQLPKNLTQAITMTHNSSNDLYFIREAGQSALDSGAFHYSVYRTLTKFLGMDGNLEAGYDAPRNWVDMWNTFIMTNDLINAETGEFDPRHMMGVTNQDVFRWPAIHQGIDRQLLGHFVTTLLMPGIPMLLWGEEQAYYILDSTDDNYIFGRQPISSATAWQMHGCYSLDSTQYYNMPIDAARRGCDDVMAGYDHRDPSAPVRNILRRMYHLRDVYPVLQDGFFLQQLSNQTWQVVLEGSSGVPTETGIWSVVRSEFAGVQSLSHRNTLYHSVDGNTADPVLEDISTRIPADLPVWLLYTNVNETKTFSFDCTNNDTDLKTTALVSPFSAGTTVKNLLHPYDEHTLIESGISLGINGSAQRNGCLRTLHVQAFDFRAYVPTQYWIGPKPVITAFGAGSSATAGHDARIESSTTASGKEDVPIQIHFSSEMDCDSVSNSVSFQSKTEGGAIPSIVNDTIRCSPSQNVGSPPLIGGIPPVWSWSATLTNVANGVHRVTVDNATDAQGNQSTEARDHFLFRIGQPNNPIVLPLKANYSTSLLSGGDDGELVINHSAAGADLYRYSTNFGSSFSDWMPYTGGSQQVSKQTWTGTAAQKWHGEHIRVEYFSRLAGSSAHVQQADLHSRQRRFPSMFLNGPYNSYGFDAGLDNRFKLRDNNEWTLHWMTEWSPRGSVAQINVWGINPDGKPDQTIVLGDIDGDSVLDRLPPSALEPVVLNITQAPPEPYLSWRLVVNDGNLRFRLEPQGNMWQQLGLYIVLWALPLVTAGLAAWIFMASFYKVKFNKIGVSEKIERPSVGIPSTLNTERKPFVKLLNSKASKKSLDMEAKPASIHEQQQTDQRTILIATMEYNIDDWNIKITIGGLGVMSQLMGKNLPNLIWVVPCVSDIEYPIDEVADSMSVTMLGQTYKVQVQYHQHKNITYVLLDVPVFRKQTQSEPYPARMDDIESAIYYSAWNQCIAQAIQRFPDIDIYHINDYHGTIAPLYLLPRTIPVCLSLHNAEFQGLWSMRSVQDIEEICLVFNLPVFTAKQYVQYGNVFNLLHAGASLLRLHQDGFGAVGVSKKYGARSHARYPILWGLKEVRALQNPDPSDTGDMQLTTDKPSSEEIVVDESFEKERLTWRAEAQEWAGLEANPTAELFVFVGRWSMQKGVDLIADAFPSLLEANPRVQLITIGPVIDLYGKFAALKLDKLMKQYPKRVFSKPEFTALPPFVFTGAEFALIPSRDEPFGLVAVEFGRKGALGVGARVGGLGQMPGWWYTVESTATTHILNQFKGAIREAMSASVQRRAKMRAISAKQRFPVMQWVEELDTLHSTSISMHALARTKMMLSPIPTPRHTTPAVSRRGSIELSNRESTSSMVADNRAVIRLAPNGEDVPSLPPTTLNFPEPPSTARWVSGAPPPSPRDFNRSSRQQKDLSVAVVVGDETAPSFGLQKVDPFFTDSNGVYFKAFEKRLEKLNGKNSENTNCIETYLMKSEKQWATDVRNARLGRTKSETNMSAMSLVSHNTNPVSGRASSIEEVPSITLDDEMPEDFVDEFGLGKDYKPPTGLRNYTQIRIGTWPLYSFLLALGQIISANSYQIVLVTGEVGHSAGRLYAIASIYLIASIAWWAIFRSLPSMYSLSVPFALYGVAFVFIGLAQFSSSSLAIGWVQNVGTGFYTIAAASGGLFFALNFGDDAGGRITDWTLRACLIQGTQQIWVVGLWYWGHLFSSRTADGINAPGDIIGSWKISAICLPLAVVLWAIGLILWFGLPDYYRQSPGTTAAFYKAVMQRKVVVWFA
ncbi:hypothetical protein PRZ48_006930 [Zasmidium cellare]|uniref:alpha-1,3-glucan synthase n=1 Tax=Zasmidium cellare TaxID=395010 RepID=A0ABR0EHY4_ZASCE|nr:hypothetical protein PRZ48_006930 [Zasmidium cellare]